MLVNSFNHFRAVSILFIIGGHSFGVNGMEFDSIFDLMLKNIVSGGTSLFVFISGFLFHHIFYEKYSYKKFMINKGRNVFMPYLILGLLPVIFYVVKKQDGFEGFFLPNGTGVISEYLIPFLKYYMSGRFLNAYWYIPFIMMVFIFSPIYIKFIKIKFKYQLWIVLLFSSFSVLIHRPIYNINVIQSVVYFTPVYLIGIMASIYKTKIYKYLKGKDLYLFFTVILFALYQSNLGISGSYHKPAFVYGGVDLMFLQKIIFCFFFMIFLNRFEYYHNRVINAVAATSFTAFFIHPFILWFIIRLELKFMATNSWFIFLLFVGVLSMICILIAKITKRIIPKYSRYIIGY